MARYIDADKLIEAIEKNIEPYKSWDCTKTDVVMDTILEAHTADVVEVKHGEWIYDVKYYSCSVCAGKRFNLLLGTDAEFCPYCGAKMDGGKKE